MPILGGKQEKVRQFVLNNPGTTSLIVSEKVGINLKHASNALSVLKRRGRVLSDEGPGTKRKWYPPKQKIEVPWRVLSDRIRCVYYGGSKFMEQADD